jgi:hypothetical protein
LADGFGDFGVVVNVTHQQLRNALLMGRAASALVAAEDCHRAARTGGFGRSFLLHAWAAKVMVGVAAGRPDLALAALQGLENDSGVAGLHAEPEVAAARVLGWWFLGRADLAAQGLPAGAGWLGLAHWRLASTAQERNAALSAMTRHWPAADGVMGWRRRVLAATLQPLLRAEAEHLAAELQQRGLLPLVRQALVLAAQAALAEGAKDQALQHVRHALALETAIDPWIDEPAAPWLQAAAVLRAAGAAAEADDAIARGRAWLLSAAERLHDAEAARWFLEGNPLHRQLNPG